MVDTGSREDLLALDGIYALLWFFPIGRVPAGDRCRGGRGVAGKSCLNSSGRPARIIEPGMEVLQIEQEGSVVDSSCFLVSGRPSFYPVFGRFWTQVGPRFGWRFFLGVEAPERLTFCRGAAPPKFARSARDCSAASGTASSKEAWRHAPLPAEFNPGSENRGSQPTLCAVAGRHLQTGPIRAAQTIT